MSSCTNSLFFFILEFSINRIFLNEGVVLNKCAHVCRVCIHKSKSLFCIFALFCSLFLCVLVNIDNSSFKDFYKPSFGVAFLFSTRFCFYFGG